MVAARKPKASPRRHETLEAKFDRVMAEPPGTPMKLTKREASYFLKRLAGSDPDAPSGLEEVDEVRGDWGERLDVLTRRG